MVITAAVVLALGAAAAYLVPRRMGTAPEPPPSSAPGTPATSELPGELPEEAPVPPNPVVGIYQQQLQMNCQQEMRQPWAITGCRIVEQGRLITVRMVVDEQAAIKKFSVSALVKGASADDLQAALFLYLDPMLEAARVGEPDRDLIRRSIREDTEHSATKVDWGKLYLATGKTTRTLTLSSPDLKPASLPGLSLGPEVAAAEQALVQRGYSCPRDGNLITCKQAGSSEEILLSDFQGELLSLSVWFGGPVRNARHPVMIDAYAALRAARGPEAEALASALAQMGELQPHYVFTRGYQVQRWETRYEVEAVTFP